GRLCRRYGALFLVDAAQTAGHLPIDVSQQPIDLLAAPGHKALLGPTGTGFLYVGPTVDGAVRLRPWRVGGTGGDSTDPVQPTTLPTVLEAGTPNVVGAAGLSAGMAYLEEQGADGSRTSEEVLLDRLTAGLRRIDAVEVFAPSGVERVGACSFRLLWIQPQEVAAVLDDAFEIAVRAGLHCAPEAHRLLGTLPDGLVRASVGWSTTEADIDVFLYAIAEIAAETRPR
ncbi:MAG: aminotransferase class V-fold PLP-dependent enzyme, partial [Planctomycetia bacterium]